MTHAATTRTVTVSIKRLGLLLSVILLVSGSYVTFRTISSVPPPRDLAEFPQILGEWRGTDTPPPYVVYRDIGVDWELSRDYRRTNSEPPVHLYIGYFSRQEQGKELVHFKTKDLHSGASTLQIAIDSRTSLEVNQVVAREEGRDRLILFWYDLNGRHVTSRYLAKVRTMLDSLLANRTNGAVIMVTADLDPARAAYSLSASEALIRNIFPLLPQYLPH